MNTTSVSLLRRLHQPSDDVAWRRFVPLYPPLLYYWARSLRLPEADAADLVQRVLLVLVEKMPQFAYDPGRSFRGWLRTIALNKWRERCRRFANAPPADNEGLSDISDGQSADVF